MFKNFSWSLLISIGLFFTPFSLAFGFDLGGALGDLSKGMETKQAEEETTMKQEEPVIEEPGKVEKEINKANVKMEKGQQLQDETLAQSDSMKKDLEKCEKVANNEKTEDEDFNCTTAVMDQVEETEDQIHKIKGFFKA